MHRVTLLCGLLCCLSLLCSNPPLHCDVPHACPCSFCCGHLSMFPMVALAVLVALHDSSCQCLSVLLREFLAGHIRSELQSERKLFQRPPCRSALFTQLPPTGTRWKLVKTGFLGVPGPQPALLRRLSGCGVSLVSSSSRGLLGPAFGGSPPGSATYSLCDFG